MMTQERQHDISDAFLLALLFTQRAEAAARRAAANMLASPFSKFVCGKV